MKTAEEWNNILHRADMIAWKEIITKIQLDAAKSALEFAAKTASKKLVDFMADGLCDPDKMGEVESAILTLRTNLTIEQLEKK